MKARDIKIGESYVTTGTNVTITGTYGRGWWSAETLQTKDDVVVHSRQIICSIKDREREEAAIRRREQLRNSNMGYHRSWEYEDDDFCRRAELNGHTLTVTQWRQGDSSCQLTDDQREAAILSGLDGNYLACLLVYQDPVDEEGYPAPNLVKKAVNEETRRILNGERFSLQRVRAMCCAS
jgi:hypothetical protein